MTPETLKGLEQVKTDLYSIMTHLDQLQADLHAVGLTQLRVRVCKIYNTASLSGSTMSEMLGRVVHEQVLESEQASANMINTALATLMPGPGRD